MILTKHTNVWQRGLFIAFFAIAFSFNSFAQHAFELALRGGTSMYTYLSDYGNGVPNYNAGIDLSYKYRSPYYIAFKVGVAADFSQSLFKASNLNDKYVVPPDMEIDGHRMDVGYNLGTLRETHQQIYVSVPVQIGFYVENFSFFVGPKVSLPLYATYAQRIDYANLWVHYPQTNISIGSPEATINDLKDGSVLPDGTPVAWNTPLQVGNKELTEVGPQNMKQELLPKFWLFISASANYEFMVGKRSSLGIGVYADYSILNHEIAQTKNISLLTLSSTKDKIPVDRIYASVLEANLANGNISGKRQMVKQYGLFNCGVNLTYSFWSSTVDEMKLKATQRRFNRVCHCMGMFGR